MTESEPDWDLINNWQSGNMPEAQLKPGKVKDFFKLLVEKGFERVACIDIDGFYGMYSFMKYDDRKGNVLFVRHGGKMPTTVGLLKPAPDYIRAFLPDDTASS